MGPAMGPQTQPARPSSPRTSQQGANVNSNGRPHTTPCESRTGKLDPLGGARRTSGWVILLAIAANISLAAWFRLPPAARHAAHALNEATNSILTPLLFLHACLLLIVAGGIIMGLGRLRLPDLGLRARGILPALLLAVALWGVLQLHALIAGFIAGQPVSLHAQWITAPGAAAGEVLGNWLGVALYEEFVFRGFLLSQLALRFERAAASDRSRRLPRVPRRLALLAALLLSAAVFAAGHLPYLLRHETPHSQLPADLLLLFGWGVLFGLTYLRTRSLWCSIAVHGLVLAPAMLLATPEPATPVLIAAVIGWLVASAVWNRARSHRRHAATRRAA